MKQPYYLMFNGMYVDITRLSQGIYETDKPRPYYEDSIDDCKFEVVMPLAAGDDAFRENFKSCEFVEHVVIPVNFHK